MTVPFLQNYNMGMKYAIKPNLLRMYIDQQFSGQPLKNLLAYYGQSDRAIYKLISQKQLLMNHAAVKDANVILEKGMEVSLIMPDEEVDFQPGDKECRVIYEDDFIYVVHKEAGIIIHDDASADALANQAALYQLNHGIKAPVRYLHRLDKETHGLVIFVKIPFFKPYFDRLLQEKVINRHYLAITRGQGRLHQKFIFRDPIGKDRHVNNRYRISPTGKPAVTKAEIIAARDGLTLFSCTLETGRTHQIRVHLSSHGFPIVNDPLYGQPSGKIKGMGLWADRVSFPNPLTGELITVSDQPDPAYEYFR